MRPNVDSGDLVRVAPSESEQVIRTLYEITSDYSRGFERQVGRLLELGCRRLGLEIGILARVEDPSYRIEACVAPAEVAVTAGNVYELGRTFCAMTVEACEPVLIEHVGESSYATHPAYEAFRLEAYAGAPVRVDGELWGTLNFSSPTPRPRRFREVDVDALRLMASWVGSELYRRRTEEELRRATARLEALTRVDPLTQLMNRRGVEEKLRRLAGRHHYRETEICSVLIDLDDFKRVNDRFGHSVGDVVLSATADTITRVVRPTDVVARVGGDEFLALLPDTREPDALLVAERIRMALAAQKIDGVPLDAAPTASIGISRVEPEASTVTDLLAVTGASLQRSKASGKNAISM